MKKTTILICLLLLLTIPAVMAKGFGILVRLEYGDVVRRGEYTDWVGIYPYDDNYPRNDPTNPMALVKLTANQSYYTGFPEYIYARINEYTRFNVTLNVPKKADYEYHEDQFCAVWSADQTAGTIGIGVGACINPNFTVLRKGTYKQKYRK